MLVHDRMHIFYRYILSSNVANRHRRPNRHWPYARQPPRGEEDGKTFIRINIGCSAVPSWVRWAFMAVRAYRELDLGDITRANGL